MKHWLFGIFCASMMAACAANSGVRSPMPFAQHAFERTAGRGAGATYDGCPVFTDGPYNTLVTNAAPDPNSSQVLNGLANSGGSGGIYGAVGGKYEPINIANATQTPSPLATIKGANAFYLTKTKQIPWDFSKFNVEDWPDGHSVVLDVKNCYAYETWHTSPQQSIKTVETGGGYLWKLDESYMKSYPGNYKPDVKNTSDASDLPFFAGFVRWNGEMDQNPAVLDHALNFSYPAGQGVSQWGYVFPADAPTRVPCTVAGTSPPQPCPSTDHVMHYGDQFRLNSSVACPSQSIGSGQPYAICQAMKNYGIIFARKGNGFKLIFASADGTQNNPYDYTDIDKFLASIKLDATDFTLLTEPPLQCAGSPCPP